MFDEIVTSTFFSSSHSLLLSLRLEKGEGVRAENRPGMLATAKGVVRTEGIPGLYRGLTAAFLRQVLYSGTRIALYPSIRDMMTGKGRISFEFFSGCSQSILSLSLFFQYFFLSVFSLSLSLSLSESSFTFPIHI